MQNTSGKYLDLHSAYFSWVNYLNICANGSFSWGQLKNYLERTNTHIYYSLPCNKHLRQAQDLLTNLQENKPRHTRYTSYTLLCCCGGNPLHFSAGHAWAVEYKHWAPKPHCCCSSGQTPGQNVCTKDNNYCLLKHFFFNE